MYYTFYGEGNKKEQPGFGNNDKQKNTKEIKYFRVSSLVHLICCKIVLLGQWKFEKKCPFGLILRGKLKIVYKTAIYRIKSLFTKTVSMEPTKLERVYCWPTVSGALVLHREGVDSPLLPPRKWGKAITLSLLKLDSESSRLLSTCFHLHIHFE